MNAIKKKSLSVALLLACGIASQASMATESGVYLGIGIGQSKFDLGDSSGSTGLPATFNTDETDTGKGFSVGYRFNPYIAVEGSYTDYGKGSITLARSFNYLGFNITSVDGGVKVKGTALALVASMPVNNWEFGGRLGAFFAKTELFGQISGRTLTSPTQILNSSFSDSANTTETLAALYFGYTIADHSHIKLEWTRIPKVGDEDKTGEGDVTQLALGYQYRF